MKAGIALGSNVGDRIHNLRQARERIARLASGGSMLASSVYDTEPVGCATGDPAFLNAVVEIDFDRFIHVKPFSPQRLTSLRAATGCAERVPPGCRPDRI